VVGGHGGIFHDLFSAYLLLNTPVKKIENHSIFDEVRQKLDGLLFINIQLFINFSGVAGI